MSFEEKKEYGQRLYAELLEKSRQKNGLLPPSTSNRTSQEQPPESVKEAPMISVAEKHANTASPLMSSSALPEQPSDHAKEAPKLSFEEQREANLKRYAEMGEEKSRNV